MKKIIILFLAVISGINLDAQDLHFAQSSQTPLFINPGAAGVYDGWERVIINHRNQWLGANTQFMTTAIAADINIGKTRHNKKPYLGLGLVMFNDQGGDSNFGNQNGSITLSGVLPMGGSGHSVSLGIQGGMGQRKADLSNVSFMSQWDGSGFDLSLAGEANPLVSFKYIDASAGLFYVFDGGRNTFQRNNKFKFKFGVAGFHLNAPELKYSSGEAERLHRKYVAHIGIVKEIQGSPFAFDVNGVQFVQGGHYETLIGAMLRYRFENGTKITGNTQESFFGFGVYYRHLDAVIPSILVHWRGFQLGMSYDVTISKLRRAYSGGSLEFSLSYTNFNNSLFKTRGRQRF